MPPLLSVLQPVTTEAADLRARLAGIASTVPTNTYDGLVRCFTGLEYAHEDTRYILRGELIRGLRKPDRHTPRHKPAMTDHAT